MEVLVYIECMCLFLRLKIIFEKVLYLFYFKLVFLMFLNPFDINFYEFKSWDVKNNVENILFNEKY
jgi:hypothetical protein